MTEKNLEIHYKLINKLLIKIKNLNNELILLSKVDKKLFKNIINQKGGTSIVNNINNSVLNIINIQKMLIKYNSYIKAYTELVEKKYLQFNIFFTILTEIIKSINITPNKNVIPISQGINNDDMKILSELTKPKKLILTSLDNPKYQDVINKIGKDIVKKFILKHSNKKI
jgi:hypothetical protein